MTTKLGAPKKRLEMVGRIALLSLCTMYAFGAIGQRGGSASGVTPVGLVPFPFIEKRVGFSPLKLRFKNFIEMAACWAILPKGFVHKLPAPVNCLQLEYGYKKSGIVRLYEMPIVKGASAKTVMDAVLTSRGFRDVNNRPGFVTVLIPDKTRFILLTSVDKIAFAVAKAELTGH